MLTKEQSTLLLEGARHLQIELTKECIAQIATYLEELQRWTKVVDLVSQSDPETIIRKHMLDSLATLSILPFKGQLLDLGSGAGFPGLPIAMARPSLIVSLLEPRRKRINFLREVIRRTALINAHAYEGRAEEFAKQKGRHSSFDVVITRATWNLKEFLSVASGFVNRDGILVAMKGKKGREELQSLSRETKEFILEMKYDYQLPCGKEKRTTFVFTKKSST